MGCSTGAKDVVMTDREPLALECALRSAAASGVAHVANFQGTSFTKDSPRAQARGTSAKYDAHCWILSCSACVFQQEANYSMVNPCGLGARGAT